MSVEILRELAKNGQRVFGMDAIEHTALSLGLSKNYLLRLVSNMTQNGELVSIYKGTYSLPNDFLSGGPLHSFEIALQLAQKGSISHRSALAYYQLTDQILSKIYVTVPKENGANLSSKNNYAINGTIYNLIRIDPKNYWGTCYIFIGEARVSITDLERTLIDGLTRPDLCGGLREVIFAFEQAIEKMNPSKLFDYAQKTSIVSCKRLGWIFEHLNILPEFQENLKAIPMSYSQRLDASGPRKGKINSIWNLLENL